MAVDPKIKQKAEDIRKKIFGSEVRESLASGIEAISEDVEATIGRQGYVEEQFQDVLDETTGKDVISAPELIAARNGEANLKTRLDKEKQEVTAQLKDDAISPDNYTGTDAQKIQQAVDYITSSQMNGGTIKLSRFYNLTGEDPIVIKKQSSPTRRTVTFSGIGGGFIKHNAGYLFSAEEPDTGDLYFNSVVFVSTAGANTTIFDNDMLIRVYINDCHFRNVDRIFHSPERWLQSLQISGGSIIGGKGYAIEAKRSYDLSISRVLVEHRDSFIRQLTGTESDMFTSTRIRDIICEGLTGVTAYFMNVDSLLIDGSYFETNAKGYIFFSPEALIKNTTISNNRLSHWGGEDIIFDSFIHWGGHLTNVLSSNNYVKDIKIHNTFNVISGNILVTTEEVNIKDTRNIVKYTDTYREMSLITPAGTVKQAIYPNLTKSTIQLTGTIGPGKITEVYDFSVGLKRDDIVGIMIRNDSGTGNDKIKLINHFVLAGDLHVSLENITETTIDFSIFITILSVTPTFLA